MQIAAPRWQDIHPKANQTQLKDRSRLLQVSLLWWSQKIYEQASKASGQDYEAVLGALASAMATLTSIESGIPLQPGDGQPIDQTLAAAGMYFTLDVTDGERKRTVPSAVPPTTNCESTLDCPEDYFCDNGICVYILPDPSDT